MSSNFVEGWSAIVGAARVSVSPRARIPIQGRWPRRAAEYRGHAVDARCQSQPAGLFIIIGSDLFDSYVTPPPSPPPPPPRTLYRAVKNRRASSDAKSVVSVIAVPFLCEHGTVSHSAIWRDPLPRFFMALGIFTTIVDAGLSRRTNERFSEVRSWLLMIVRLTMNVWLPRLRVVSTAAFIRGISL